MVNECISFIEWTKLKYSEEENYFEESFNIESQFSIADIQYLIDYQDGYKWCSIYMRSKDIRSRNCQYVRD
jgi:hypothetical protein